MKISLEWLKDFVDFDEAAEIIAQKLTMAGLEVEAVEKAGGNVEKLKVAKILKIKPHPKADKLKICEVDAGDEKTDVVCGAPNIYEGLKSIWAPPGTELPDGRVIEEAAIRGSISAGMLCSLQELGLEEKSTGIHEFDDDVNVGDSAAPLLDINTDIVLEVAVTPNRGDALSVEGVARDLAAVLGKKMKYAPDDCPEEGEPADNKVTLEILDPVGCPRYVAKIIEGIKIGPSPLWMRRRLENEGIRAINNIVDITNYVMMEVGQPLHAFDMDTLAGPGIVVRRSKPGEKFVTLDNAERVMEDDLLICDVEKPVALAGVMGGLNSEVTENTVNVLLESACFEPSGIRRTSKRLGLPSEASYRFERGVDPCLQPRAANLAAALMAKYAGGKVLKGALDDHTEIQPPPEILLGDERVELYLGIEVPREECKRLLESIGFEVKESDKGLIALPPSWRGDVAEEADVIEEIARLYGYDRLPVTLPEGRPGPVEKEPEEVLIPRINESMVGAGYHEIITLSFMNPDALDRLEIPEGDIRGKTVPLLNPLSREESVMRTSLIPGLLNTASYNLKRLRDNIRLFEIGRVFIDNKEQQLPDEPTAVAGVSIASDEKTFYKQDVNPFYRIKGAVEEILSEIKAENVIFKPDAPQPYMLKGENASILIDGESIGYVGRIRPSVAEKFDISEPVHVFELDLPALLRLSSVVLKFKPLPVHPPAFRDIAFVVKENVPVAEMMEVASKVAPDFIENVEVFDVYRGKPISEGFKSVAFSIVYQWPDRSPVDEEVNELHGKVVERLKKKFGVEIR